MQTVGKKSSTISFQKFQIFLNTFLQTMRNVSLEHSFKKSVARKHCKVGISSNLNNFPIKYNLSLTVNMLRRLIFVGNYFPCALIINCYIIFPSKSVFEIQFMESLIYKTRNKFSTKNYVQRLKMGYI